MNRLSKEKSPYLQMHADNPVDWYAWDSTVLQEAQMQDKPVFLSIGYSACHWCHVIAHESFEDEEIAALLNQSWISVKVDKEERPDIDAVYMDAVELATGSGGWPMTILMLPDGKPFFAASYLPKDSLAHLLERASFLWTNDRQTIVRLAEELTQSMRAMTEITIEPADMDASLMNKALKHYLSSYDQRWGGFGHAPKFPSAHNLLFLLAHYEHTGEHKALEMAEGTLDAMARGGMFDQIGGGFSRYSVDRQWLVPHFEKMLYDNALLLWTYAEAWRITHKAVYRTIAERTAAWVLQEMTIPEGAFCCAQDADSSGKEGAFYVFTQEELLALLGRTDGQLFCRWYQITKEGNFEGKSIPNLIGKAEWMSEPEDLSALRERVYRYRRERLPLQRDDKILTSWNAMMIAALCRAAQIFNRSDYLEAAQRAEAFLKTHLSDGQDGLFLRWRDGEARGCGVLADYTWYALALLTLYESTKETAYLSRAKASVSALLERFADGSHSGFYLYSLRGEQLITHPKDLWDGAMPSGNSCIALVLHKLAALTKEARWQNAAQQQLRFIAGASAAHPTAHSFGLYAATLALSRAKEKELAPRL